MRVKDMGQGENLCPTNKRVHLLNGGRFEGIGNKILGTGHRALGFSIPEKKGQGHQSNAQNSQQRDIGHSIRNHA